jgi:hypothetical protein
LEPCDGGLNFVGFSRTRGFDAALGLLVEAWRMVRGALARRVRQMAPPWGRRKRGIVVDMAVAEEGIGSAVPEEGIVRLFLI